MSRNNAHLLSALKLNDALDVASWPLAMLASLPDLLARLLKSGRAVSLERLQLINVAIAEAKETASANKSCYPSEFDQHFYKLSGDLPISDDMVREVFITYFMRGQRQFFKPQIKPVQLSHQEDLPIIGLKDIEAFLAELNQGNTHYFDQRLAQLNGRPLSPIPSQMLLALALLKITPAMASHGAHHQFSITFLENAFPNQRLKFGRQQSENEFNAAIFCEDRCLLWLSATLSQGVER